MRSNSLLRAAVVAALAASTALLVAPSASADPGDDAIVAKYNELGASGPANGPLGPIQSTTDGGKFAEFAKWNTTVAITWRTDLGAHWFSGAIEAKWSGAGGAEVYGHAAADQEFIAGGHGAGVRFSKDFSVYYSPATGAQTLYPPVRTKYWQLGNVSGIAGFPTSDVTPEPAVTDGQFANFQNGVSIYHSADTGSHWISGAVRSRAQFHGPAAIGHPSSDQFPTFGADGVYALFGFNRAIIYGPQTGAWLVADDFLDRLRADGDVDWDGLPKMERASLEQRPNGSFQHFQFATITNSPETNTHSVALQIRGEWWKRGGYVAIGLPTAQEVYTDRGTDEFGNPLFSLTQNFENGNFIDCFYLYEVSSGTLFYNCDPFAARTAESGTAGMKPAPSNQIPRAVAGKL